MKNDKDKEQKLKDIEAELTNKVEQIMGPVPENTNTAESKAATPKKVKKEPKEEPKEIVPTTAPVVESPEELEGPRVLEPPKPEVPPEEPKAPVTVEDAIDQDLEKAVDDIAAKESDALLSAEDEAVEKAFKPDNGKKDNLLKRWWHNKKARNATFIILLLIIAGLAVWPTSRYLLLNTAGVRSSASLTVIDESTQQPLKNVDVTLQGAQGVTNDEGKVTLKEIKLGDTELAVERRAFKTYTKQVTVGWGSNPLGNVAVTPTGLQYALLVKDYLSGKPIEKAEAISGDASAFSNAKGEILLTLDTKTDEKVEITIKADSYRDEKISDTGENTTPDAIAMVPSQKQTFISKRSGKYDVYKIDADGKNEALLLSGTGYERDDMALVSNADGTKVALVSTRDNVRKVKGELLSTLTVVDVATGKAQSLETAERVQLIGWSQDNLVFVAVGSQNAPNQAKSQRLVTYDAESEVKTDVTSSTYFNDVMLADNTVYYAPAVEAQATDGTTQATTNVGFYKVGADGNGNQKILDKEIWNIVRSDAETIVISGGTDWYEYKVGGNKVDKLNGAPANQNSRTYTASPDRSRSAWVDKRDGKGVLLSYDVAKKADTALLSQSGLVYPVRWLNNSTLIYRINTDQETADYVISVNGGQSKKVVDVTNTSGVENWYYY